MLTSHSARRVRPLLVVTLAVVLAALPLAVLASHRFGDVPTSHPFHADISAIADAGVTSGCGGGNYCPSANVTRGEMAAFMNRLGALAPGKAPVVNATKLDGLDSSDFLKAGPVVMAHDGEWATNIISEEIPGFGHAAGSTQVIVQDNGEAWIQAGLAHPAAIGATGYGLRSVEICWAAGSSNVTIGRIQVARATSAGATLLIDEALAIDPTAGAGCDTWETAALSASVGNTNAILVLNFSAAGTFMLATLRSTWVPIP